MTRIELLHGKKHQFDKLLFDPSSQVLNAYVDLLIKPTPPPEVYTYSRLLVDYSQAHGKICQLFELVAEHEITPEICSLKTFPTDSPLMRLYFEYANNSLLEFGKNTMTDVMKLLISNVNVSYNYLIKTLANNVIQSLNTIPIQFVRTLQVINSVIEKKQGKQNLDHWIYHQLFFTKFFCALLENPYLLLQNIDHHKILMSQRRMTQFSHYITQVVHNQKGDDIIIGMLREVIRFLSRPMSVSVHDSGIDIDEQNRLHPMIVEIFKENEKEIFKYIAHRDKAAKISAATAISPEVIYSRMGTAFSQSITPCGIRMNQMQAMHDCLRLFKNYEQAFSERSTLIEQENTQFRDYLLLLQHQIEIIKQQIEEEKKTRENLQNELNTIEHHKPN